MKCQFCQNEMQRAKPWEYQGKMFTREICVCGNKTKAFIIPSTPVEPTAKPITKSDTTTNGDKNISFAMAYAKDLVCAMIKAGIQVKNPASKTVHLFRPIYRELSNPFSVKFNEEKEITEIEDFDIEQDLNKF